VARGDRESGKGERKGTEKEMGGGRRRYRKRKGRNSEG